MKVTRHSLILSRFPLPLSSPILLFSYFSSSYFFFSVMLLHSVISRRWAPWSSMSFLQVESRFSLVIAFCLVFSHVSHSPAFLLSSCFVCATVPLVVPLPLSRCHRP
ncbi:hypothetical protein AAZX31_07G151200 [Glycine max]